jgi:hypothetical protein
MERGIDALATLPGRGSNASLALHARRGEQKAVRKGAAEGSR